MISIRRRHGSAEGLDTTQPTPAYSVTGQLSKSAELIIPIDVLELIVEWIIVINSKPGDDLNNLTLAHACLVNRMWCFIVRPHLYKRVALKTRGHYDAFLSAVRWLPNLGSNVRALSVLFHSFEWGYPYRLSLYDLPWILMCLPMLYELRLNLEPNVSIYIAHDLNIAKLSNTRLALNGKAG